MAGKRMPCGHRWRADMLCMRPRCRLRRGDGVREEGKPKSQSWGSSCQVICNRNLTTWSLSFSISNKASKCMLSLRLRKRKYVNPNVKRASFWKDLDTML
jgi:hypothetical protein